MKRIRTYIGVGSNQDNPLQQVNRALAILKKLPKTTFIATSSLYQSPPWGTTVQQPDFINAVVAVDTGLTAMQLLTTLTAIEKQQGRVRIYRWGPRRLDLDMQSEHLTLPHPEMKARHFVLYPLAEIAPKLILPDGQTLQHSLLRTASTGLIKLNNQADNEP